MDDNVTEFPSGVNRYGTNESAAIADFPLQIKDSPVIQVSEPDAGTVMDLEEATSTRAALQLFLGDDFGRIEDHLNGVKPDTLVDIVSDLSRHFKLNANATRVNRAERRRQSRKR